MTAWQPGSRPATELTPTPDGPGTGYAFTMQHGKTWTSTEEVGLTVNLSAAAEAYGISLGSNATSAGFSITAYKVQLEAKDSIQIYLAGEGSENPIVTANADPNKTVVRPNAWVKISRIINVNKAEAKLKDIGNNYSVQLSIYNTARDIRTVTDVMAEQRLGPNGDNGEQKVFRVSDLIKEKREGQPERAHPNPTLGDLLVYANTEFGKPEAVTARNTMFGQAVRLRVAFEYGNFATPSWGCRPGLDANAQLITVCDRRWCAYDMYDNPPQWNDSWQYASAAMFLHENDPPANNTWMGIGGNYQVRVRNCDRMEVKEPVRQVFPGFVANANIGTGPAADELWYQTREFDRAANKWKAVPGWFKNQRAMNKIYAP